MEYLYLGNKIKLLFRHRKLKKPDIDVNFNSNTKIFRVTIWVNEILNFALDDFLELNQSLLHKDIIKKYEEKAKEEDLDFLQVLFINNQYCFLIDSWSWLTLMHSNEY